MLNSGQPTRRSTRGLNREIGLDRPGGELVGAGPGIGQGAGPPRVQDPEVGSLGGVGRARRHVLASAYRPAGAAAATPARLGSSGS